MKYLKLQPVFFPVLLIMLVLVSPAWLAASADGDQAVAKLQQLRSAQNEQTKIANMKANSIEISKRNTEMPSATLKKALKERSLRQAPKFFSSSAPDLHRISPSYTDDRSMTLTVSIDPIIYGHGKMTYASSDSMYFNFLTNMNGIDTTGMDVELGFASMGMAFGNFGSFENDSSLIMLLSRSGVLGDVSAVPAFDDPATLWTGISDSVDVGDLWAVYTRTSHLYAVLQVTSMSESYPDEHIAFDYMIQTNGSNIFSDTPPQTIDITVNGREADTLYIGSEPFFSITLGTATEGTLIVSWDQNHNGVTDETDIPIEEYEFSDNDMHDLNPADSIFDFIYDNEMADGN